MQLTGCILILSRPLLASSSRLDFNDGAATSTGESLRQCVEKKWCDKKSLNIEVHRTKGLIFEDGPNFDTAYRLFHGQNSVVSLSEPSSSHIPHRVRSEPAAQQYHPLAARAATISL
ncbi:hypothetical protein Tco_0409441 [Tanacetum coccineum]